MLCANATSPIDSRYPALLDGHTLQLLAHFLPYGPKGLMGFLLTFTPIPPPQGSLRGLS